MQNFIEWLIESESNLKLKTVGQIVKDKRARYILRMLRGYFTLGKIPNNKYDLKFLFNNQEFNTELVQEYFTKNKKKLEKLYNDEKIRKSYIETFLSEYTDSRFYKEYKNKDRGVLSSAISYFLLDNLGNKDVFEDSLDYEGDEVGRMIDSIQLSNLEPYRDRYGNTDYKVILDVNISFGNSKKHTVKVTLPERYSDTMYAITDNLNKNLEKDIQTMIDKIKK